MKMTMYKKSRFYSYQLDVFEFTEVEAKSSIECGAFCSISNCNMYRFGEKTCQTTNFDKKSELPAENNIITQVFVSGGFWRMYEF